MLDSIDQEYAKVRSELQVYTYKYNITKQVVQSTMNEEMVRNIREQYQKPFEEAFTELKEALKGLEERKRFTQMFVDKINRVLDKGEEKDIAHKRFNEKEGQVSL